MGYRGSHGMAKRLQIVGHDEAANAFTFKPVEASWVSSKLVKFKVGFHTDLVNSDITLQSSGCETATSPLVF